MGEENVRALIISVGKDVEPVVGAVNRYHPEALCFFVAEADQGLIDREIIPKIERPPRQWDQVATPDPSDLMKCCRVLGGHLPSMVARWGMEPSQVVVDSSGGSRTMSSALFLCAADYASGFITGEAGGPSNLWDERAAMERKAAAATFNRVRYLESADHFDRIQRKVSGGNKPLYKALVHLSMGYAHWDVFDYRQAWNKLQEARKALEMASLFGGPPGLKEAVSGLKENLGFLEKLALGTQEVRMELFWDLLSNAERRAGFENNFEDAALRVFRALEVLAQVRLLEKGIRSMSVEPDRLPDACRIDYSDRYKSEFDGKIKVDFPAAFRLLKILGDGAGEEFEKNRNSFVALLEARDQAVLGHGMVPMKKERYEQIMSWVLKVSGGRQDRLPRFPRLGF